MDAFDCAEIAHLNAAISFDYGCKMVSLLEHGTNIICEYVNGPSGGVDGSEEAEDEGCLGCDHVGSGLQRQDSQGQTNLLYVVNICSEENSCDGNIITYLYCMGCM